MSATQQLSQEVPHLSYQAIDIIERFLRQVYPIYTQMYLPAVVEFDLRQVIKSTITQYITTAINEYHERSMISSQTNLHTFLEPWCNTVCLIAKDASRNKGYENEEKFIMEVNHWLAKITTQLTDNEHYNKPSNQA